MRIFIPVHGGNKTRPIPVNLDSGKPNVENAAQMAPRFWKPIEQTDPRRARFEATVLCHLNAAYNLARWMMGQESDARDVVQTAALRAFSYIDSLRGEDGKAWLLGIVRNCCLSALRERSQYQAWSDIDEIDAESESAEMLSSEAGSPHVMLERKADRAMVNAALGRLAPPFREVLILREMEDMSYEMISAVVGVPIGTVMSRLSRARRQFREDVERLSRKDNHE